MKDQLIAPARPPASPPAHHPPWQCGITLYRQWAPLATPTTAMGTFSNTHHGRITGQSITDRSPGREWQCDGYNLLGTGGMASSPFVVFVLVVVQRSSSHISLVITGIVPPPSQVCLAVLDLGLVYDTTSATTNPPLAGKQPNSA